MTSSPSVLLVTVCAAALLCVACGSADDSQPAGDKTPSADATQPSEPAPAAPAPAPMTSAAPLPPSDYDVEKAYAEAHGVTIEAGKVTVVAKRRGADALSTTYDDTLVVFRSDGTIARFAGTTKPAQMPVPGSSVVPDVDGDGRKDLGIVRPGVYRAHGGTTYGVPGYERSAFKVTTETDDPDLPAWRDLTGDGVYSASEKMLAEQRSYTIDGIYIHYGFAPKGTRLGPDAYIGPWSVGCQNVQYDDLDDFVAAVGGADATFRYAIVHD